MLDSNSGLMFTKAELKDIFKRIDIDNTNSLDFYEVLSVSVKNQRCNILRYVLVCYGNTVI